MYQPIGILQLVCQVYRAPYHHLHDNKGQLQIVNQKGEFESKFFVTTWISFKLNHNGK